MKRAFDLSKLVAFRHEMHRFPEGSLQEFETTKRILRFLTDIGVPEHCVTLTKPTGLVVDIRGKAPVPDPRGLPPRIVMFRADIDALEMREENSQLPYRSVNGHAHMCGHDGHTTALLGAVSLLLERLEEVPETSVARFVFQPAEEKFGGAKLLVEQGCLEGVSEAWGLHNVPFDPPGHLFVKAGPVTSDVTAFRITVVGKGGHSSAKSALRDPLLPACEMNVAFERLLETEFRDNVDKEVVLAVPALFGNFAFNVISPEVRLEGTLRAFDLGVKERLLARMRQEMEAVAERRKVQARWEVVTAYSLVRNDERLAEEFKGLFPESSEGPLPFKFSEDFSAYSEKVPSCFFFLCAGKRAGESLHANNYDFGDELVEPASQTWNKLVFDRLTRRVK